MGKTPDILFEYLRCILYDPANAKMNIADLDPEYKLLGEGFIFLGQCIQEQRDLAQALAKGKLSEGLPSPENELAAPLKALHASLRHLTWQAEQVAKGDYQQRVDFMGDFSIAFNAMIVQLDQRQRALKAEIESSKRETLAAEQSNRFLVSVMEKVEQIIMVLDCSTHDIMFYNKAAEALANGKNSQSTSFFAGVNALLNTRKEDNDEYEMGFVDENTKEMRYFMVRIWPVRWNDSEALALVFADVTEERRLEGYAFQDSLTGVYSRLYGMDALRNWMEEKRKFSICFCDLDNLKYVNDTFGHREGDKYILSAAHILSANISNGIVCRLGGDEFMVLLADTARREAEALMESVCNKLRNKGQEKEYRFNYSFSYGVVEVGADNILPSADLLSLADERMYHYKRTHKQGRGPLQKN